MSHNLTGAAAALMTLFAFGVAVGLLIGVLLGSALSSPPSSPGREAQTSAPMPTLTP